MSYLAPVLSMGFNLPQQTANAVVHSTTRNVAPSRGKYHVIAVEGFASLFGIPFTSTNELAVILSGRADSPEQLVKELRGTVTITLQDIQTGSFHVFTDMYGAGKIFIWQESNRWAVSSSVKDLVSFLHQNGIKVKKSIENAGLLGFVGYGGGAVSSPYEMVTCVDQFKYVTATADGKLTQLDFSFKEELVGPLKPNSSNQEELLQSVVTEIRRNISAFSSYQAESYICHLTGGLDSRVVFAALVDTPYKDQYSTFTYGLEESPDMVIARRLTAEYGLTASTYSGMRYSVVPQDPALQALWSLRQTGGMTSMGPASIGGYPKPDSVVLAGGWGEMYRGGYPDFVSGKATHEEKIKWIVNWILRSGSPYGPRISYGGLFSDAMVQQARDFGQLMLNEIQDLGLSDELLAEWMYLRWSTRFNVAEITRTCLPFTHRADPLCVPDMMKLIYSTPFEDRKNGNLELDLVKTLHSGMERYPYDKDYLTEDYLNSRGISGIASFDESLPIEMKWHFDDKPHHLKSMTTVTRPTATHKAEALRVKMPLRFVVRAEENRRQIQNYVREVPEEMSKVFNLKNLKNVTDSNPKTRPEYRRLETLSSALSWHFDEE